MSGYRRIGDELVNPASLRVEIRYNEGQNQFVRSLWQGKRKFTIEDSEYYGLHFSSITIEATEICLNEICSEECESDKCLRQLFSYENMNRRIVVTLRVESKVSEELWDLILCSFQFMILEVKTLNNEQLRQLSLEQRCEVLEMEDEVDLSNLNYDMLIQFQDLYFHQIEENDGSLTNMFKDFLKQMRKKKFSGRLEYFRESETTVLNDLVLEKQKELGLAAICSHDSFAFYRMEVNQRQMLLIHVGTPFILVVIEKQWSTVILKMVELALGKGREKETEELMKSSGHFDDDYATVPENLVEEFLQNLWTCLTVE